MPGEQLELTGRDALAAVEDFDVIEGVHPSLEASTVRLIAGMFEDRGRLRCVERRSNDSSA